MEIPDSQLCKGGGMGTFCVTDEGDLILSYNQNRDYVFHKYGKLVRIKQQRTKEIYKTKHRLWAPVLYDGNIYMVTQSVTSGTTTNLGVLSKFNSNYAMEWQFKMDGATSSLPVVWKDSIFFTDSIHVRGTKSNRNLYRLNNQGEVLLKKPIQDYNTFEPWILKQKEQIILKYGPNILEVFNFDGKSMMIKKVNGLLSLIISEGKNQRLFATTDNSIAALDQDLNVLWEYRPFKGLAGNNPVFDSAGNLYGIFHPRLLKSIDQQGKERWQSEVKGYGYQPYILENDNVLTTTSLSSGLKEGEVTASTWLELFSSTGNRLGFLELPGYIYHCTGTKPGEVIVATNCIRNYTEEEIVLSSIKIFSLRYYCTS